MPNTKITQIEAVEVDGQAVMVEDLVAAYIAAKAAATERGKLLKPKGEGKSFEFAERERQVREAWQAEFTKPSVPGKEQPWYHIRVFDDMAIVELPNDGLYSYPYSIADDGEITFGEPVKGSMVFQADGEGKALTRSSSRAIKALREQDGGMVVGGPLLLFGDPTRKDLQDEYFTPETWLGLAEYKSVPALFHHGLDDVVGLAVMGHRVKAEVRDTGVWVEDWLDISSEYWKMVKPLLEAEALFYSPGSAPHLVKRQEDGRLDSFPVVEDTLTPVPAQHRLRPVDQVKAAYKAAGLAIPDGIAGGVSAGAGSLQVAEARARAALLLTKINEDE